jgi:hypothetical protein
MLLGRNVALDPNEETAPDPALLLCQKIDLLIEQDDQGDDDDQDERSDR